MTRQDKAILWTLWILAVTLMLATGGVVGVVFAFWVHAFFQCHVWWQRRVRS